MNISKLMHNCSFRVVSLPPNERRKTATDDKIDLDQKPIKANPFVNH